VQYDDVQEGKRSEATNRKMSVEDKVDLINQVLKYSAI
jgi:hypothetical protein